MFLTACSFIIALFASPIIAEQDVVLGSNSVTLSFSRSINITGSQNLLARDQNRAKALRARASIRLGDKGSQSRAVINENIDNQAVTYIAAIGIGSPATTYQLLVDTGSSNTWVGAGQKYVKTSTSKQTANSVSVTYGSGSFSGTEYTDSVTIAPGLTIPDQSIGVASRSSGFEGTDGILGLGPADLTDGTLSPATTSQIPTVSDNAFSLGLISANQIGISFKPTTVSETINGELTWGGIDSSKFTDCLDFVPVTKTSPANLFWGIDQSITYGTSTNILSTTAGIVDTGTTLMLISSDAFNRYRTATGAVLDNNTGLLKLTSAQYSNLKSLFFTINGLKYEFTANAQIWPRSLNTLIGGTAGSIYSIVNDIGTPTGQGLDFINGFAFIERFYTAFDYTNRRVGFATTSSTLATTN